MGAWIETENSETPVSPYIVAPHVGAWIETWLIFIFALYILSHPTWVRGLKQVLNLLFFAAFVSHPTWVRGLKHIGHAHRPGEQRRTPRGCVD